MSFLMTAVYTFLIPNIRGCATTPTVVLSSRSWMTAASRAYSTKDVVYDWTRALDPATGATGAYMLAPVIVGGGDVNAGKAADLNIRALDDVTVEITAPEKVAYALGIYGIITSHLTPEWAIAAAGDAWTEPENINTIGPFALKEWVHDDHVTFIKNPFWPGSAGYKDHQLDEITIRFLDDGTWCV